MFQNKIKFKSEYENINKQNVNTRQQIKSKFVVYN